MSAKWFPVWYRHHGMKGAWTYGWSFASDSLIGANRTIEDVCRAKDKGRWDYRAEEIDRDDFDYPQDADLSTNSLADDR